LTFGKGYFTAFFQVSVGNQGRFGRLLLLVPPKRTGFFKTVRPGKVSMKRRSEGHTMVETRKCEYCEKDAAGYQSFGCCFAYVCLDHADNLLLALKPGEKLTSGECYFERFSITD
jgi:hypothetical protein